MKGVDARRSGGSAGLACSGQAVTALARQQDLHNAGLRPAGPSGAPVASSLCCRSAVISVMYKPSASLRELAALSQGPRPPDLHTPTPRGTVVRVLALSCQWRSAKRSAVRGPAGNRSRPVTALACPKPERPALPNPAPVRVWQAPRQSPPRPQPVAGRKGVAALSLCCLSCVRCSRRLSSSQPTPPLARSGCRCMGARLPLRSSHAPPRPPPAHSAPRPKARAAPPILGCRSLGCCGCWVVSGFACRHHQAGPWSAGRGGRRC